MRNLADWIVPRLAWLYLQFVGQTSQVHWLNFETKERLEKEEKSFIYAFWHGRQVFMAWLQRYSRAGMLVSRSKDGGYIAEVLRLSHTDTVRGSSSRGGARALIELKKFLDRGRCVGITPDGPRGPQRIAASGALYLAQKTGKPVLPITVSYRRKLIFKGWDDFWVPLPFNRAVVLYGNPIAVGRNDGIPQKSVELAAELNRITEEADALCRGENPEKLARARASNRPVYPYPTCAERFLYALYNLGLVLFSPLILLSVFLRYPRTFLKHFGKGLSMRMGRLEPAAFTRKSPIWIHASSLGECRAALPLIEALKKEYPGKALVFSSGTAAGIAEARRLDLAPDVLFAPLDLPFILRRVFDRVRPRILILMESELWPNWLRIAQEKDVPVVIANGRISQKSAARYAALRPASRILMRKISFIAAREKTDAERFAAIGMDPQKIEVTGNLKFDRMPWELDASGAPSRPLVGTGSLLWTAGSVRQGEEEAIVRVHALLRKSFPDLKLVLAPRHFERLGTLLALLEKSGLKTVRRSIRLKNPDDDPVWDVCVWDTFGDLWQAYRESSLVFVGGSLVAKGGQNPIEPAWFAKPVLFGPHMENFDEPAGILLREGGAVRARSEAELESSLRDFLENPDKMKAAGQNAKRAVENFKGRATQKTMDVLKNYLHD